MQRKTNAAGVDLIKTYEGCRLTSYQDSVGVWTIGYGSTSGITEGKTITQEQAEDLLRHDLTNAELAVERLAKVELTDNQFAALVSFTFNLGAANLAHSTLLKKLNAGDYVSAAGEFKRWNRAGKKTLPGLVKRRDAEAELFAS